MAEFKFSCSHCGQHIACNTKMAGRQVLCPGCRVLIRIPPPPGVSPEVIDHESGRTWQTFGPAPIIQNKMDPIDGNTDSTTGQNSV